MLLNVIVFVLYVGLGWLTNCLRDSLVLQIPFWLPAGLALSVLVTYGRKVLPGIWAGAFVCAATYVTIFGPQSGYWQELNLTGAFAIAWWRLLLTHVGALIIRRLIDGPRPLTGPKNLGILILVVGPLCGLFISVIGGFFIWLTSAHVLLDGLALASTWGIANANGIAIMTPLTLLLLAPQDVVSLRRKLCVAIPVLLCTSLAIGVFLWVRQVEHRSVREDFRNRAHTVMELARNNAERNNSTFGALASFIRLGGVRDNAALKDFLRQIRLDDKTPYRSVRWRPELGAPNVISRKHPAAQLDPRSLTAGLNPLAMLPRSTYSAPLKQWSEPATRILKTIGEPFRLSISHGIYQELKQAKGAASGLIGTIELDWDFKDLLDEMQGSLDELGLDLEIHEVSDGSRLFGVDSNARQLRQAYTLNLLGHRLEFIFSNGESYLEKWRPIAPWACLAAGMLIIGLLQALLLVLTEETASIQRLVAERSAQLDEKIQQLRQSNQDLDNFAHIASHDLREPIRAIRLQAEYTREDEAERLSEQGKGRLMRIVQLTEHMTALVQDLYEISRVRNAQENIEAQHIPDLVDEAQSLLESLVLEKGGTVDCVGSFPSLRCDRTRTCAILRNLIKNGLIYNESPQPKLTVRYHRTLSREGLSYDDVISVEDNGIGIEAGRHDLVFQVFKRLGSSAEYGPGSGLGLAHVQRLVQDSGDELWLESTPGQGSTFYFTRRQSSVS